MTDNSNTITGFQTVLSQLWSAATEYHMAAKVLKHQDLKPLGHKFHDFGEQCEGAAGSTINHILVLSGHPSITTDAVTDDYGSLGDIFDRLAGRESALKDQLNDLYAQCLTAKDADSAHDHKDVLHCCEKRLDWIDKQINSMAKVGGEAPYRATKI